MRHGGRHHREHHKSGRGSWLRAAVLGSNDAIVSTSSLMIGVAASSASKAAIMLAGVAGLVAGAMSMAVGEYVSVSSQRDAEHADVELEKHELASDPRTELRELAGIYEKRGLDKELAMQVAQKLSARDPLEAHLRDELGIEESELARPMQAAITSATSFGVFALIPIVALWIAPRSVGMAAIAIASISSLVLLGALGARLGGAKPTRPALRVAIGGVLAMIMTAAIGRLFT